MEGINLRMPGTHDRRAWPLSGPYVGPAVAGQTSSRPQGQLHLCLVLQPELLCQMATGSLNKSTYRTGTPPNRFQSILHLEQVTVGREDRKGCDAHACSIAFNWKCLDIRPFKGLTAIIGPELIIGSDCSVELNVIRTWTFFGRGRRAFKVYAWGVVRR